MTNDTANTPDEKSKTKTARKAMYFGVAALASIPFLGTFAGAIRPKIDEVTSEAVGAAFGFSIGIAILALAVCALIFSIRAYRQGDRSKEMWIGLVPAILVGLFWAFMMVGEFVFPH